MHTHTLQVLNATETLKHAGLSASVIQQVNTPFLEVGGDRKIYYYTRV